LGTFAAGPAPGAVTFDGENIWVASNSTANTVTKLRASDGVLLGTFTVGQAPAAIIFDGANIWLANVNDTVSKL
jgi:DNA-binding beta-propeller fold protein YncE